MLLYPHPYIYNYSQHHSHHRQYRNNVYRAVPYSPLRTESPTNHTPTPTADAMEAAITGTCTAQTNFIDGIELEGDFFSYCDNRITGIDERDDLCY